MNQELAGRGFKIDLDSLPRSTILAQKGNTNYTWGELQDAWAERKDTKEGSAFDGEAGRESRTIKLEERIEKLKSAKDSAKTQRLLLDAENELAELNESNDAKLDASLETDTTIMSENQARSDKNKKRMFDEDGNAINSSSKKGTKPKVTKKRTSENGTTAWGDVPTMFMEYVDAIRKILSIEGKINIVYRSDLASTGMPSEVIKLADNVFRRGAKAAVVQHKGQRYIVLKKLKVDNAYRQAEQLFILGHEMGHIVMWDMWTSLPQAQKDRLQKQFDKERLTKSAGAYTYTDDSAGFEEWFADQVSAWAKKQATKPADFSEAFFKKVAKQVTQIFNRSRQFVKTQLENGLSDKARAQLRDTKERGTLNETFEQFMDEVAGKGKVNFVLVGGPQFVSDNTSQTAPQGAKRPDPKKQELAKYQEFSKDPLQRQSPI